jgi:hypothetical protein
MSIAKDLWLQIYEARVTELLDQGMPEPQAEASAERYANRALPDRLADAADYAYQQQKDARR